MTQTFFFYDLETSGLSPRDDRIMQFAGQRTSLDLKPIGDPINIMVRLSDDILPSPDAVVVTGITPQQTLADGYSEPEFCQLLMSEVFLPGTITVGFNSIRFDDEFIRHTLWRNFYDPYEWAWSEGRSRWDLLDVVRMTRALRPDGIEWPVDESGKAVNKLELLSRVNNLTHSKAHDALSDVEALIGVARLIRDKQTKIFDYLLGMRDKRKVMELVSLDDPKEFVYSSGRYDAAYEKTTIAIPIAPGTKPGSVLVYDLRVDPVPFVGASARQLALVMSASRSKDADHSSPRLPIKELSYNRCPAVAPVGVVNEETRQRLGIDPQMITRYKAILDQNPGFGAAVAEAYAMREPYESSSDVEHQLYQSFTADPDKPRVAAVRVADQQVLADFHPQFVDDRLDELLLRYKARNFPAALSEAEQRTWQQYRTAKLTAALPQYMEALQRLAVGQTDTFLLEELQLWAESIMPLGDG